MSAARPASRQKMRASTPNLFRDASKTDDDLQQEELADAFVGLEINKFQDALKLSKREIDDSNKEALASKSLIASKDRLIQQLERELEGTKDKMLQAEGGLSYVTKELSSVKAEKKKLDGQVLDLTRQGDRLNEKLLIASSQNPLGGMQVAGLMSELKMAKTENDQLAERNKVLEGNVRMYERETNKLLKKLEDAEFLAKRCLELENRCLEFAKQVEDAKGEIRSLQQVVRGRDAELAKATRDHDATKGQLSGTRETLSRTTGELKATQNTCQELEREMNVLKDELVRASAVAKRVAVFEVKAGTKDEGSVPATRHLEEVKYMSGENQRLKERMSLLEKDLSASHALSDRFKRAASVNPTRTSLSGGSLWRTNEPSASGATSPSEVTSRPASAQGVRASMSSVTRSRPTTAASNNSNSSNGIGVGIGIGNNVAAASTSVTPRSSSVRRSSAVSLSAAFGSAMPRAAVSRIPSIRALTPPTRPATAGTTAAGGVGVEAA